MPFRNTNRQHLVHVPPTLTAAAANQSASRAAPDALLQLPLPTAAAAAATGVEEVLAAAERHESEGGAQDREVTPDDYRLLAETIELYFKVAPGAGERGAR